MSEKNMNNQKEKLPFAKNEVYRLMKLNLDSDRMIKDRVKVEMNRFLYSILVNVCRQLNEYPYTTIDYEMFKECIYPYTNIEKINEEKQRILTATPWPWMSKEALNLRILLKRIHLRISQPMMRIGGNCYGNLSKLRRLGR